MDDGVSLAAGPSAPDDGGKYLRVVTRFADTLLEHGRDRYGPQATALWAAVINTDDYSVPPWSADVPALPGIHDSDRAVGGSNLYHDLATLHTLRVLSAVTGDARYEEAVRAYVADSLRLTQSPETGLLAWGEHLYYYLYLDTVMEEREWHEFLSATPPGCSSGRRTRRRRRAPSPGSVTTSSVRSPPRFSLTVTPTGTGRCTSRRKGASPGSSIAGCKPSPSPFYTPNGRRNVAPLGAGDGLALLGSAQRGDQPDPKRHRRPAGAFGPRLDR